MPSILVRKSMKAECGTGTWRRAKAGAEGVLLARVNAGDQAIRRRANWIVSAGICAKS